MLGQRERHALEPGQRRPERLPVADVTGRLVHRGLGAADGGQREQRPGEVESAEHAAEGRSLGAEQGAGRHFDLVEVQQAAAHRRPAGVPERGFSDPGGVQRDQERRGAHRLPVAHGPGDHDDRPAVAEHGDRSLVAADHVAVRGRGGGGRDRGDIGAAARLGQPQADVRAALDQRPQPGLPDLIRAVPGDERGHQQHRDGRVGQVEVRVRGVPPPPGPRRRNPRRAAG